MLTVLQQRTGLSLTLGLFAFSKERLLQNGIKPVRSSGAYLINAFVAAAQPFLDFADRYMASLKGTKLTADHTFR